MFIIIRLFQTFVVTKQASENTTKQDQLNK